MATRAEFRWAAWRHWGRHLGRCNAILAIGAAMFLAVWFLLGWIEPAEPPEMRAESAMAVAIIVGIGAAVMSAQSALRDADRDPSLICPHCDGVLGYYRVMIVLSSGNCPHCGERVIED